MKYTVYPDQSCEPGAFQEEDFSGTQGGVCSLTPEVQLLTPYGGTSLDNPESSKTSISIYNLFRGIQHLHERGIYHFDIKADNVLLTTGERGRARFIDFGNSLYGTLEDPGQFIRKNGRFYIDKAWDRVIGWPARHIPPIYWILVEGIDTPAPVNTPQELQERIVWYSGDHPGLNTDYGALFNEYRMLRSNPAYFFTLAKRVDLTALGIMLSAFSSSEFINVLKNPYKPVSDDQALEEQVRVFLGSSVPPDIGLVEPKPPPPRPLVKRGTDLEERRTLRQTQAEAAIRNAREELTARIRAGAHIEMVPIAKKLSIHDTIHQALFGMPLSTGPYPRILPGSTGPTQLTLVNWYLKDKLAGFFVASVHENVADIWSVSKNPEYSAVPGVFEALLAHYIEATPTVQKIVLQIDTSNTSQNTEFGRWMLQWSLGFRLAPGQTVELIWDEHRKYPNGVTVVRHDNDDLQIRDPVGGAESVICPGYVMHSQDDLEKTPMVAVLDVTEAVRADAKKRALRKKPKIQRLVDAHPAYYLNPSDSQLTPLPNTHRNEFPSNFPDPDISYVSQYHSSLLPGGRLGELATFTIPSNITLVQFSAPGSYTYGPKSVLTAFAGSVLANHEVYQQFVSRFPGLSAVPFDVTTEDPRYELHTMVLRRLARRPVINVCGYPPITNSLITPIVEGRTFVGFTYKGMQFMKPQGGSQSGGAEVKGYQYFIDIQAYSPGMHAIDAAVEYTPESSNLKDTTYDAVRDMYMEMGTLAYTSGGHIPTDDIHTAIGNKSITRLSQLLQVISMKHPGKNVTVLFGGCAGLDIPGAGVASRYYELMHRRSIRYTVGGKNLIDSLIPYLRGEQPTPTPLLEMCPRPSTGTGRRKTRRVKRKSK